MRLIASRSNSLSVYVIYERWFWERVYRDLGCRLILKYKMLIAYFFFEIWKICIYENVYWDLFVKLTHSRACQKSKRILIFEKYEWNLNNIDGTTRILNAYMEIYGKFIFFFFLNLWHDLMRHRIENAFHIASLLSSVLQHVLDESRGI